MAKDKTAEQAIVDTTEAVLGHLGDTTSLGVLGDAAPVFDPRFDAEVQIAGGTAACADCLFFAAEGRECRKSPPPRGSGQPFPQVAANAWCGEFRSRDLFAQFVQPAPDF